MIKTDVVLPIKYSGEDIKSAISSHLPIDKSEIFETEIIRRTLDLSDTSRPVYKATVAFCASVEKETGLCKMRNKVFDYNCPKFSAPSYKSALRPYVVGAGPAGLFAALVLAESGARPIVVERGDTVEKRTDKVALFNTLGILDSESNIQFGEGGAGTFSDGKLKFGSRDKYKMKVIREFIDLGASEDIAFSDTAHLGTDKLVVIVKALRERIISLGGEFIFGARLSDIKICEGQLKEISYIKDNTEYNIDASALILATGHSARDTYFMLKNRGLKMSPKGFGIGLRIEHPREYVNKIVYKEAEPLIEDAASYHLVTHLKNGRSVYSFCMCPGGSVVAAASEEGGIVTNGMSEFSRNADNSNSALLVSVSPEDFSSDDALSGIELQRRIERGAFSLAGEYKAPAQNLDSFLSGGNAALGGVSPSYPRGVEMMNLNLALPSFVTQSIRAAFSDFDSWLPGYKYGDALLTAPETRTTAPVRILRDECFEAYGAAGVYPSGEGAGYAGGIISSAVDGIRCAEALIEKYGR